MEALTIEQLFEDLKEEIEEGHGDYIIFVSDYEEANSYHPILHNEKANNYHALYYRGSTAEEMGKGYKGQEYRQQVEQNTHNRGVLKGKTDKAYYIG